LYEEGEFPDEAYLLAKGRVNLIYGGMAITYKSFLKNSYFGEIEIMKNILRIDTIQCFGNCEFFIIT